MHYKLQTVRRTPLVVFVAFDGITRRRVKEDARVRRVENRVQKFRKQFANSSGIILHLKRVADEREIKGGGVSQY